MKTYWPKINPVFGIIAIILIVTAPLTAMATETNTFLFEPGVYYFRFLTLPGSNSPDSVLSNQLPGGAEWSLSTRIVTTDLPQPLGCYYDTSTNLWRGTLKELKIGRGYWLVIPRNVEPILVQLDDCLFEAGSATTLTSGFLIGSQNGYPTVTPSAQPQSSGSYKLVKAEPQTISASSKVFIQNSTVQPQQQTTQSNMPWVRVELDTVWNKYGGAKDVWYPIPPQGNVNVVQPANFDIPPWGTGELIEPELKTESEQKTEPESEAQSKPDTVTEDEE
jgi:hypothetical protein